MPSMHVGVGNKAQDKKKKLDPERIYLAAKSLFSTKRIRKSANRSTDEPDLWGRSACLTSSLIPSVRLGISTRG